MELRLQLGHTTATFLADSYVPWDDRLSAFCQSDTAGASLPGAEYTYTICLADHISVEETCLLRETRFFRVYADGRYEVWYYTFPDGQIYASCRETRDGQFTISYLRDLSAYLAGNATLFYLSALEYRMVRRGDLVLHASYVLDDGQALLFTAPSGTGKSTQAHLWRDVRGSRIINGDRTLLHKEGDHWYACGWPMSGSSGISQPCMAPIRAVLLLSQAPQNQGHPLSSREGLEKLKQEIVLRPWQREDVALAAGLLENFCQQVPVIAYACRKDTSAVADLLPLL